MENNMARQWFPSPNGGFLGPWSAEEALRRLDKVKAKDGKGKVENNKDIPSVGEGTNVAPPKPKKSDNNFYGHLGSNSLKAGKIKGAC